MTLDELYPKKRIVYDTFFATRTLVANFFIIAFTILVAIYVMKDSFSFLSTGLILWLTYLIVPNIIYRNQIFNELKSRQ